MASSATSCVEDQLHKKPWFPTGLNLSALLSHALSLRRRAGESATFSRWVRGSDSLVLNVRFDDETEWIAKLPLQPSPDDIDPIIVDSEASTMKLVRERTTIP